MKKIIVIVVIIGVAIAGAAVWYLNGRASDERLSLYGNVDIRDVDLGFRVAGRIETMAVEEGDPVEAGQLLATLDEEPFVNERNAAAAQLAREQANLAKLEAGSRNEEIQQARALVSERRATLANLQRNFERIARLIESGAVSQQQYDQALSAKEEAEARLVSAQEALDLALEGSRDEDIAAGRAAVAAAQAQLDDAERRLRDTELRAPSSGTILARVQEKGSILSSGQTIYTVSLDDPVWIRAYVAETDLGEVWPGRKVTVYTDGTGGPYQGTVGFISPTAEFTPKSVQTEELRTSLVYRLRIIVPDPDRHLRQGMPVTVDLEPDSTERPRDGEDDNVIASSRD